MTLALILLTIGVVTASGCGFVSSSAPQDATDIFAHDERDRVAAVPLRVCADPNNLPFTNNREEGFENRIAELVARDLGTRVEYVWWAQRRGFVRNTLNAGVCDVVMGLPTRVDMALTTEPYYRSTYVFVTRRDRDLRIHSFDDARLKALRIGVPMVGDDGASAPPAHALARRGMLTNLVQYSVFGDYRQDSPPSALIAAVARGDVDVAAAWGPLAGYFAARQAEPLDVTPVDARMDGPFVPLAFDISMAVRRGDSARKGLLDRFIERRRLEIEAILAEFGVPRVRDRGEESF
jgi:mxaJ protein